MSIKSKKGFTIIEVVLVLAIAGLIFLMVFIALPAMQRNQRDTQRRNDYSALSAALTQYMNNNNGKLPLENAGTTPTIYLNPADFVNTTGKNSNGDYYEVRMTKCDSSLTGKDSKKGCNNGSDPETQHASTVSALSYTGSKNKTADYSAGEIVDEVWVFTNADCSGTDDGHDVPAYNRSKRAFAIYGALESGTKVYCSASNS